MSEDSSGRLRRRAETILSDGHFEVSDITATSMKELLHELYVHQAELEIQNEELRGAQQALEASRLQYLQLFQSVPLACLAVNATGIVGEANAAAERQFGLPMLRLKGRPLTLLVDGVDHGRLFTALGRLRDHGEWARQEFRFLGPQGTVIDGLTDARRVTLDDSDRGDVLLTITDLTERNAWLREVQQARDDAERARADYHHILQSVGDGILGVDADGRIRFVNAAATAMTGHLDLDLIGRPPSDLLAGPAGEAEGLPGGLPDVEAASPAAGGAARALALSLTDGRPRSIACEKLRREDGGTLLVEVTISPMLSSGMRFAPMEERIQGAVVAFRDVTARRTAEAALNLSERRHRVLVQSLHDALAMTAVDGRSLLANAMAERLLGGPARALLDPTAPAFDGEGKGEGRADGQLAPATAPDIMVPTTAGRRFIDANGNRLHGLPPAAEAVRSGKPVAERIIGVVEGEEATAPTRWLRVSSRPVADPAGRVEAVVSSVADITAVKALERDLNVALDARERFLAAASHDLRQPVQALLLLSDLLMKEELSDGARRMAEQIQSSLGGLGGMLDGMLDISKLEAGLVAPNPETVDITALLGRLHGEFAPLAEKAGQNLRLVAPHLTTRTDPRLLERVLRNLLANALRFAPGGRVLLGARRRGDRLQIEVWDSGIGIADQHIDRIFQDFFQVGNAARDRREGLGLGLSIARRLVTMLGGTIDVTSSLGRGSRFTVCLPLTEAKSDTVEQADSGGTAGDGTAGDGGRLVMLVEDDAVIRMALVLMLEDWNYRVVEAGSGAEAEELLGSLIDSGQEPDLILADYRLPEGTTGLMVMDMVRRRLSRDVPGVLLTGDTSADRLREAAGAQCALLHKPIQPSRLQDTLASALNLSGG
ncbi:PAS domain S-box-containing protein [Azospirillum lipoferum]|uniref:histidine kinase n=1 Tax=Azospirillum lipoferum TaxID=193 RepID=A0A5A9GL97_AZOLI|nr:MULTISPECIES: PAS domain S-box protein [Azospirillum]KAA0594059.1 PAS domain S-box protein [Azospirillum lipoferum]MCP1612547.1 PAS domain S-box-containing protein [Azospirillum lipoferum]MDW5531670.1 PAS domain S-box protein [Azospirillum sp. NL1]